MLLFSIPFTVKCLFLCKFLIAIVVPLQNTPSAPPFDFKEVYHLFNNLYWIHFVILPSTLSLTVGQIDKVKSPN